MDLEQLTKHQIVLLTLLVSFVTSIATGIVTVSLVNQAPPEIQRTINQIVERTVETVQAPLPTQPAAATAAVEKTVVVKDDDLAAQSIAKVQQSVVRVVARHNPDSMLARGVSVSGGVILTDRSSLVGVNPQQFEVITHAGTRLQARLLDGAGPVAQLGVAPDLASALTPAGIADASKVKLGASVIRIGGGGADTVGTGVVAALPHDSLIQASVVSATPGSVLITLFGEVLGITTGHSQSSGQDHYSIPPAGNP